MRKAFAVELLRIPDSGCLVASGGLGSGLLSVYSSRVATGLLWGIQVLGNTFEANGSIYFFESGGNHQLVWGREGTANASGTYYPRGKICYYNNIEVSGVGNTATTDNIAISNIFHVVLSGVGPGTSGLGFNIIYI